MSTLGPASVPPVGFEPYVWHVCGICVAYVWHMCGIPSAAAAPGKSAAGQAPSYRVRVRVGVRVGVRVRVRV